MNSSNDNRRSGVAMKKVKKLQADREYSIGSAFLEELSLQPRKQDFFYDWDPDKSLRMIQHVGQGTFFFRKSTKGANFLTLSVRDVPGSTHVVRKFTVSILADGIGVFLVKSKQFANILEFVQYYKGKRRIYVSYMCVC